MKIKKREKNLPTETRSLNDLLSPSVQRYDELLSLYKKAGTLIDNSIDLVAPRIDRIVAEAEKVKQLFADKNVLEGTFYQYQLVTQLISDLKHYAFENEIVSNCFKMWSLLAWNKKVPVGMRKQAKKILENMCKPMLPNLRKEKSSRQFDIALLNEFEMVKQALHDGLKRNYKNQSAKQIGVNEILKKQGMESLARERWDKILPRDNTHITYVALAKKHTATSALIEKNVKKLKRERQRFYKSSQDHSKYFPTTNPARSFHK